jgi:NADPH-dependent curcumin reductase CurA
VGRGRLKYREDVVEGQENAPAAFPGLLQSENFGKVLVKGRMSQSKQSERSFDPPPGP